MRRLMIVLCLVFIMLFCGCNDEPKHEHIFATEWTSDQVNHWHVATCGHEEVSDLDAHVWDSGKITTQATCTTKGVRTYTCTVCEQAREEDLGFSHEYGLEVDLGNGVKSMTCALCGDVKVFTSNEKVVVILCNIGFDPTYVAVDIGVSFDLPVPESKYPGYVFLDWNSSPVGLGASYGAGGTFSEDTTLYARWGLPIGSAGPAGGYVFYDCDADNGVGNNDGLVSTECGWRYLEAAPEDLSIGDEAYLLFGYYRLSPNGNDLYVNGSTSYVAGTSDSNDGKSTGTGIGTGKANTEKLVKAMGTAAFSGNSKYGKNTQYAAKRVSDYSCCGYGDWFLPSKDELNLMYTNLEKSGICDLPFAYWSSSEVSGYSADRVWVQNFKDGTQNSTSRGTIKYVRCVRAFTSIEQLDPLAIYITETIEPTCTESGWLVYKFVDTDKEACRVLYKEPTGHAMGSDGYHCSSCGHLMAETGIIGPAGGYVFYDCDEDNDRGNADGLISTECGWRYLEAMPEDLQLGDSTSKFRFGFYRKTPDGDDLYVNGTTTYVEGALDPNDGKSTGVAIGTGRANTAKLVKAMGNNAYTGSPSMATTDQYAAKVADDYVYEGYDDWFLPSSFELQQLYVSLCESGLCSFASDLHWSSSESGFSASSARIPSFYSGDHGNGTRVSSLNVICVRAFTPIEQLNPSSIYLAKTIEPTCTESGWKVYKYVDTDKEACRVLYKEPTGHTMGTDGYHCSSCGHLMAEAGIIGPAGGYVFYDCDEDNAAGNADGLISTECGWRYLEAAPENLRIGNTEQFIYGFYRTSSDGDNLYVNGTTTYTEGTSDLNDSKSTGTAVGTGKTNTEKLVNVMGGAAYTSDSGTATTDQYAAKVADDYVYGGYGDWFLPSKDELNLMYTNLTTAGLGNFASKDFWSSSESYFNANYAWLQFFSDGGQYYTTRYTNILRVRCVRAF